MMGAKLNEGEKTLMRFAMSKERQRIIKLIEESKDMVSGQERLLVHIGLDLAMAVIRGER
jgi:hypothetical protein